jgi:hypothetical protein
MRDLDKLQQMAARHGEAIGTYAPRCSTSRCRGPRCVRSTGCSGWSRPSVPNRVEQACVRALECEAIDVGLIARIVARAAETDPPAPTRTVVAAAARFARDPDEFAVVRQVSR